MNCLSNRKEIVELLDLSDEIILTIMNKVKPQAILFCSIVNIGNDRLEQVAFDKCHSVDTNVLPRIYNNIQSLTISLKHLLHVDVAVKALDSKILPNLRHLKILAGRRRHYTGTPFTINFYDDSELHHLPLYSYVPQSVYMEDPLINLTSSVIRRSPLMRPINSFEFEHNVALLVPVNNEKIFAQSSYLTHVSVTLRQLPDCVRLLNQLGSQLLSFTVSIVHAFQDNEDDYFNNQYGQCQIYSVPFIGNRLDFISNRFPLFDIKKTFINVTMLSLFDDVCPFENGFFERVTQVLPRLQTLQISNQLKQKEKTETTTNLIEFSHLSTLILHQIHVDYGKQLLCRARLPHLVELVIRDDVLSTIIYEDNEQARNNCSKVETLFIVEPWIEPTSVHLKFFPKLDVQNR